MNSSSPISEGIVPESLLAWQDRKEFRVGTFCRATIYKR
jgi:hypothetical protein